MVGQMPNTSLGFRAVASVVQVLALVVLARPAPAQPPAGEIRGRITSGTGTAPGVADATVLLEGTAFRATLDSAGGFTIPNVPAGSYTLVGRAGAVEPYRRPVAIQPGRATEVEIVLGRAAAQLPEL